MNFLRNCLNISNFSCVVLTEFIGFIGFVGTIGSIGPIAYTGSIGVIGLVLPCNLRQKNTNTFLSSLKTNIFRVDNHDALSLKTTYFCRPHVLPHEIVRLFGIP